MKKFALALAASAILATPAYAGAIFSATSATIDSGGPGAGSIADTFNQNGLLTNYVSGVTDFDTFLAGNPIHDDIFFGNEWFSEFGTNSATVIYDLGSAVTFDRLALWNEETSGFGTVDILTSNDLLTFTSLLIGVSGTDNPIADYGADVFGFSSRTARYVVFEMSRCPQGSGSYNACAIGEVAFRSASAPGVPEPATWALMLLGFAAVGASMRRKQAARVKFAF